MKRIILGMASSLFCIAALADMPPVCPSASDMKTAQYLSNPVFNISLFSNVDNGFVMVNGPTPQTAQFLLLQTSAPYSYTATKVTIPGLPLNVYYCAYAPGMDIAPSQSSLGIYWISGTPSSAFTSVIGKK